MKWLKIGTLVLAGVIIVALLTLCAFQFRRNAQLSAAIAEARAATTDGDVVRRQHATLAAAAPEQAEAVRAEQEEIARRKLEIDSLRSELKTLQRRRQAVAERLQTRNEQLKARAAAVPIPPGMFTPETLQNVGRATPAAAWQTWQWMMQTDDWKTKMELAEFEPAAHGALQAVFDELTPEERAAFGTPERMGLIVLAADAAMRTPGEIRLFPRVQFVSETSVGPDETVVNARWQRGDGSIHDGPALRLKRFADGWKMPVGPDAVPTIRAHLAAMPPTQRLGLVPK